MNITDKLNAAVAAKETQNALINKTAAEVVTSTTEERSLGTGLKPSVYLPIRTARYWADVEAGLQPEIAFYHRKENGVFELHDNATKGFSKILDMSAFQQVLRETAFELSYKGESDIALFHQDKQIVPLKIALIRKQYFPNGGLMFYQGIVNFDTGTVPWIMTKTFSWKERKYKDDKDKEVVVNEVIMNHVMYHKTSQGEGENRTESWVEIPVDQFNTLYKQQIVGEINLGAIEFPVVTLTNTGADRYGSGTSDTKEVADVLSRLDAVADAIDRATKTSKTRLYNKRKNGTMDLKNGATKLNQTAIDIMDDVEMIEVIEDPNVETGQLQVTDKRLDVTEWLTVQKMYLQEYYSHTGENVAADAHGNNQHTYEVQSKGDNKYRRATSKRTQRQAEIKQIINIIISMAKAKGSQIFSGVDEIAVNINEVDIRKEYQIEDKVEKLLNMGLISSVQALMKVEGIDESTAIFLLGAKAKHDELFKEKEEDKPAPENNNPDPGAQEPNPDQENTPEVDNGDEE